MTVSLPETLVADKSGRLARRSEYQAMRGSKRHHTRAFVLQARRRAPGESRNPSARFGLTVTKKTGNAVERNRIRRRLREAIHIAAKGRTLPEFDYVLIARREALTEPFTSIVAQLARTLDRVARLQANPRKAKPRTKPGAKPGRGASPRPITAGSAAHKEG